MVQTTQKLMTPKTKKKIIPLQLLKQTCGACPTVWEGTNRKGTKEVYMRYRHGYFSMMVGDKTVIGVTYYGEGGGDGVMNQDEMIKLVKKNSDYRVKWTDDIMGPE